MAQRKAKKTKVTVRDLKPKKDAKGGGGTHQATSLGTHQATTISQGTAGR